MDKEQLAKAHPELLAQIQAEARAESEAKASAALGKTREDYLAMTRLVAGEEAAGRLEKLLAANLTPDQVKAFASAFGDVSATAGNATAGQDQGAAAAANQEQKSRAEILAAIKQGDVSVGKGLLQQAIDTHPQHFEAASRSLAALDANVTN